MMRESVVQRIECDPVMVDITARKMSVRNIARIAICESDTAAKELAIELSRRVHGEQDLRDQEKDFIYTPTHEEAVLEAVDEKDEIVAAIVPINTDDEMLKRNRCCRLVGMIGTRADNGENAYFSLITSLETAWSEPPSIIKH